MPPSCLIVMPVYNEAECIAEVCREWLDLVALHPGFKILVVDDGSTDGTGAILRRIAECNPALTLIEQKNAGHGVAVRRAYSAAVAMNATWVFQIDSDRQFIPGDFDKLWHSRAVSSFILGDRVLRHDNPIRVFLSHVHRLLLFGIFGISVRDPNIPYRLMRGSLLAELLPLVPAEAFAPNVMLSLLARKCGEDLLHIPVTHQPRTTGTVSINGPKILRIGLRWAAQLLRFRMSGFSALDSRARARASMVDLV